MQKLRQQQGRSERVVLLEMRRAAQDLAKVVG